MTINIQGKKTVRIYAAGGGGTNIGASFEEYRQGDQGFAALDTVFIDTSKSNLSKAIPQDKVYMIDGLDGSGKIRSENFQEISMRTKEIIQKFKPANLNIILATACGGSGSVIGPMLAAELLAREEPVVVVTVGSDATRLDAENTLKTLKSYEGIARKAGAPIVIAYNQNSKVVRRSDVDQWARTIIVGLAALFSGENHELDSRDLFNFLRFDRVTGFRDIFVAALTMTRGEEKLPDHYGRPITVATLAASPEEATFYLTPEYQAVGVFSESSKVKTMGAAPFHFVTSDSYMHAVAKNLTLVLDELHEAQQARVAAPTLIGRDESTSDGMVF